MSDSCWLGLSHGILEDIDGNGMMDLALDMHGWDGDYTNEGSTFITLLDSNGMVSSFQRIGGNSDGFTGDSYIRNSGYYGGRNYVYFGLGNARWGDTSAFVVSAHCGDHGNFDCEGSLYVFIPNTCDDEPEAVDGYEFTGDSNFARTVSCATGYEGSPSNLLCQVDAGWSEASGCEDIDGCASENGSCSSGGDNDAVCIDISAPGTGYYCSCGDGLWEENGVCVEADGCASSPCNAAGDAEATCTDVSAPGTGAECACSSRYEFNSTTCVYIPTDAPTEPPMAGGSSANEGSAPLMFSGAESICANSALMLVMASFVTSL